ncbi:MAG: hypothetical protein AB7V43_03395 [Acidimicrobiia bacterium]
MSERPSAINDEAVARLRARIGIAQPHPQPPWYLEPGTDAFRHIAEACGDDNPLWCDPSYAAGTVWGGPIAPPQLNGGDTLVGENEVVELDADSRALLKGDPLKGAHAYYSGGYREWWAPIRPGMRISRRNALVGVHDKSSEFADRVVHEWTGEVFATPGTVLSAQYRLMIRTDRQSVAAKVESGVDKYAGVKIEPYTDDQIAEIDDAIRGESARRRGAQTRWWEDVNEGDELPQLVKGPFRVTDIVVWHTGMGMGLYGVKALRLGFDQRQRVPGFFRRDDLNVPDVQQRVHWDQEWARRAGSPAIYDYGRMRETWLIHLCTDWMGDDAWLSSLNVEFRRFNYVGDTHWMRGKVVHKYIDEQGSPAVDLEVWGENQRGEMTCPGHAKILLPSHEHGPVRLPTPPGGATNAQECLEALVHRFADIKGDPKDHG